MINYRFIINYETTYKKRTSVKKKKTIVFCVLAVRIKCLYL